MTTTNNDNLPQDTCYGKAWTWDPNASEPQKNLESFLQVLAKDPILQEKVSAVKSTEEVVQLGKQLGFQFNVGTLESRTRTLAILSEDDMNSYTWARWGEGDAQRWALLSWQKL